MRIDNREKVLPVGPKRPSRARHGGESERAAGGPDKVSLSGEVQRLRQARIDRVDALRAQVQGGTYEVDLDAVAEAIVSKEGT